MKIFIDGQHGTAGEYLIEKLNILSNTHEICLLKINDSKNEKERYEAIQEADIAVLCLPDEIAAKTCSDLINVDTIIIDTSTYHRTLPGWTYGYTEFNHNYIFEIIKSKRISAPGCFATGIMSILNPIKNIINQDIPLILNGITGYSAGGKKTIQKQEENPLHFRATYLNNEHFHVKEIKHWLDLKNPFAFLPSVSSFKRGQMVSTTFFQMHLDINLDSVILFYKNYYKDFNNITVLDNPVKQLLPEKMSGRDDMEIYISQPSQDYIFISSLYDNLGKGSSGSIFNIIKFILESN